MHNILSLCCVRVWTCSYLAPIVRSRTISSACQRRAGLSLQGALAVEYRQTSSKTHEEISLFFARVVRNAARMRTGDLGKILYFFPTTICLVPLPKGFQS